jgi:hypothetical protein
MPGNYMPIAVVGPGTEITDVNSVLKTMASNLMPTAVVKDVMDLAINQNYLGSPIHNMNDYNKDLPEFQRAGKRAWTPLVQLSMMLNEAAGGAYYRRSPGESVLNNPSVWQYLGEQRLGGGVMTWVNGIRAIYDAVHPDNEVEIYDIPFAKAVWVKGGKDNVFQTMVWEDFQRLKDGFDLVDGELSKMAKSSKVSASYKLERLAEMEQNGELQDYFNFYSYAKKDEEYQKRIKAAQKDDDKEEVKRLRQEQLEFRTDAIAHISDHDSNEVELQKKVERIRVYAVPFDQQKRNLERSIKEANEKKDKEKATQLQNELGILMSDTTMLRNAEMFKDYESAQRDWIRAKNNGDTEEAEKLWDYMMNIARMLD